MMKRIDPRILASQLTTECIGRPLVYAPRLTSTQVLAARLAERGWREGVAVLAEEQTAGRGRQGRSWWAPFGQALLLSVLLRPRLAPRRLQQLTMAAALAAAEAIEAGCDVPVALKWPNDLYVQGRKVGGILTETRLAMDGEALEWAIVGIGVNVAVDFTSHPELQASATSLHVVAGRALDRMEILVALMDRFEARYQDVLAGRSCRAAWVDRLLWLGEVVEVKMPEGSLVGTAVGVNEMGALLVQQPGGKVEAVWAGDVTLRRHDRSGAP